MSAITTARSLGLALTILALPAQADSVDARCDIYPRGSDHASAVIPCVFSQRQGAVTIRRNDGVVHELVPEGETPGNFLDAQGRRVFRQSGLGRDGLIFRLPAESVYVYWNTAGLPGSAGKIRDADEPYSTADYDAITRLRCRIGNGEMQFCPAGILRMEAGQASIVITGPKGNEFTLNFMRDYINSAGHEIDATRQADTWLVTVDADEYYEVPIAAIEGG